MEETPNAMGFEEFLPQLTGRILLSVAMATEPSNISKQLYARIILTMSRREERRIPER